MRIERVRPNGGERAFALVLLLVASPIIALIALFIRLSAGRPVFYGGTRLGRDKRAFRMLKLRTLRVGAQRVTGSELLGHRHELTIRGGRFLRDTRLDELPQLWNIVRGEMSFIGPRPERPEVFEAKCAGIPGYERRFDVRPGLIGISQLFTPHGTPKRYRTLIDNGVIRRKSKGAERLLIVLFTIWVVLSEIGRRGVRQLVILRARLTGGYREKRRLRRVAPQGAVVHFCRPGSTSPRSSRLVDLNEETLLVECEYEPGVELATELVLDIPVRGCTRPGRRSARCTCKVMERRAGASKGCMVIHYQPCSPRSEYMIHQYFLRASLAVPRRSLDGALPYVPPPVLLPATLNTSHPAPLRAECEPVRHVSTG